MGTAPIHLPGGVPMITSNGSGHSGTDQPDLALGEFYSVMGQPVQQQTTGMTTGAPAQPSQVQLQMPLPQQQQPQQMVPPIHGFPQGGSQPGGGHSVVDGFRQDNQGIVDPNSAMLSQGPIIPEAMMDAASDDYAKAMSARIRERCVGWDGNAAARG